MEMPGPWDHRVPEPPSDHDRFARAMADLQVPVTRFKDSGKPGHTLATTYWYECGCVRTYKADQVTLVEREFVTPCPAHGNLLTALAPADSVWAKQQEKAKP